MQRLIFPNQHLTEEAQIAFAKRFGDLELLTPDDTMKAVSISNQKENGSVYDPEDFRYKTLRGNEGWHTDSSYMPLAAKVSILSAQVVPEEGGETEVADMRAAYDELSDSMKDRVSGLEAYHSLYQSQAKIGYNIETGAGYGYHTKGAPLRPLVKTHPITGRKSLFIGRCHPGDVLMWDNRCVLHRARPYDFSEIRVLRHTRVAGDPKSELVTTGRDERASDFRPSTSNRPDLPQLNKTSF